jgi:hypothetical protein
MQGNSILEGQEAGKLEGYEALMKFKSSSLLAL